MQSEVTSWGLPARRSAESLPGATRTHGGRTLAQVMDRSYKVVYRFARLQLGADDAEDVTAEVFTIALRRLDDLPADPDRAHAWVMSAARRVIWSHIRSLRRRRALVSKLESQYRPPIGEPVDARVDLVAIQEAITRLGRRDREVIGLLVADDLDREGMARVLGCTSTAAGVRIHRARKRLRQALAELDAAQSTASTGPASP